MTTYLWGFFLLMQILAFLDMMIQSLVETDEQADNAVDPSFVPLFRR